MKPDPYTHKKLLEYTMSMIAQGWSPDIIKRELRWAGHSQKAIEAVLHEVLASYGKDVHTSPAAVKEAKEEEAREAHSDHQGAAKDRAKEGEAVHPHEKPRHEHEAMGAKETPRVVRELDEEGEEPPSAFSFFASLFLMKSTSVEKTFSALYFVLVFILIIWTGLSSESPVANVFAGFLPIILTILTVFALHDYFAEENRWLLFVVPLLWSALFLVLAGYGNLSLFSVLDSENIAMLNFILGLIFVGCVYFLSNLERSLVERERMRAMKKKAIAEITGEEREKRQHAAVQELDVLFTKIEEDTKHLNMAINKVYAERYGGSPAVRDAVRIMPEWFHEYRHIAAEYPEEKLKAAKKTITHAYERLMDFKKDQQEVFGPAALEFHHPKFGRQGKKKIIEVLAANTQEPVQRHYDDALEQCSRAIEALKRAGVLGEK